MTTLDFIVAALAAWHINEVWRHGSLFQKPRAKLEAKENTLSQLLLCPFCLSFWVGFIVGLLMLTRTAQPGWMQLTVTILAYGLAVVRASNLLNDVFYDHTRTPKFYADLFDDPEDEESDEPK